MIDVKKTVQELLEEYMPEVAKLSQAEAIEFAKKQVEMAKISSEIPFSNKQSLLKTASELKERAKLAANE